ncbi:MAG: 2Fe-2S iron-sulfur cluster-binding protein, partial [Gammaproteobacteria bacterium]
MNQKTVEATASSGTLLLDIIRDQQKLTGTKEACREGDCGACQVLLGEMIDRRLQYHAINACLLPLGAVSACHVVTIEGLNGEYLNPIQQALVEHGAIQCGFCTPGLVVALTGFFLSATISDENAAIEAVAGNLCRCTGYAGIKRAIGQLCRQFDLSRSPPENRIVDIIGWNLIPSYFSDAAGRLVADAPAADTELSESAVMVAGGTDLFVQKPRQLLSQPLHFLKAKAPSRPVRFEQNDCIVDALAT